MEQIFRQDYHTPHHLNFNLLGNSQDNQWAINVTLCQSREDRPPWSPAPLSQQSRVSRQDDLENAQTTVTVESTFCPNIASQCTTVVITDNTEQHNTCPGLPGFHNPWPGES